MAKCGYATRYEKLSKELVTNMLGFKEGEENFVASMNYIMSNLLYHHCLDVNSHNVQRSLHGLFLKMAVHGHQKKADRLQHLTEQFLSALELEDKGDLKWSLLSVLIDLAQHPARDDLPSDFINFTNGEEHLEVSDTTHTDLLKELTGEPFHFPNEDDTLSDWSNDIETPHSYSSDIKPLDKEEKAVSKDYKNRKMQELDRQSKMLKDFHLSKSWLANNLQIPYWNPENENIINEDGKTYPVLTEYVVMRECIWVLMVPSSGYLFLEVEDQFQTRSVALRSLSHKSLQQILEPITSAASKLLTLDRWLSATKMFVLDNRENFGTFQSYSDGLLKWRRELNKKLNTLENKVCYSAELSPTLIWLLHELEPQLSNLCAIFNIHSKAFSCPLEHPSVKALKLLSLLVQSIETGGKGCDKACMLVLFTHALKNHLKCLYSLLWGDIFNRESILKEFGIIRRCDGSKSPKTKFCVDGTNFFNLRGLNFLRALQTPLIYISELQEVVKDLKILADVEFTYLEELVENGLRSKFGRRDIEGNNEEIEGKFAIKEVNFVNPKLEENIVNAKHKCFKDIQEDVIPKDGKLVKELNTVAERSYINGETEENENNMINKEYMKVEKGSEIDKNFQSKDENKSRSLTTSVKINDYEEKKRFSDIKNAFDKEKETRLIDNFIDQKETTFPEREKLTDQVENSVNSEKEIVLKKVFSEDQEELKIKQIYKENIEYKSSSELIRGNITFISEKGKEFAPSEKTEATGGLREDLGEENFFLVKAFNEDVSLDFIPQQIKDWHCEYECLGCSLGLDHLLSSILLPVVENRYDQLGKMVMSALVNEHCLKQQLTTLMSIVLLSSTHVMAEFYSNLFYKIDNKEALEGTDLTQSLQYCLSFSNPSLSKCFGISIGRQSASNSDDPTAIPWVQELSIAVDFLDVWPLCIVVKDDLIPKYNNIFGFCLMLKRAVFTLERLHFREIASYDSCCSWNFDSGSFASDSSCVEEIESPSISLAHRVHRLQLLRQWLLYFAGVLHNHFTTAVLIPFSQKIEELLEHEEHFYNFTNEHEKLLNRVCHQCLLSDAKSPIQTALSRVSSFLTFPLFFHKSLPILSIIANLIKGYSNPTLFARYQSYSVSATSYFQLHSSRPIFNHSQRAPSKRCFIQLRKCANFGLGHQTQSLSRN